MVISKCKEEYVVEENGEQLVRVKTYRNPHHMTNCYIDFDLDKVAGIGEMNVFRIIANEEKSPLQVILSSLETQKAFFLASQRFKKVRRCYGMEVKKRDLLATLPFQESKIGKANSD